MTQDEIIRMAREAGLQHIPVDLDYPIIGKAIERFAALVAAHEREKWKPAFSKNKQAPKIENGSVRFEAGLYTPLEVQLAIDLLEEREACAKVCIEEAERHEEMSQYEDTTDYAERCLVYGKHIRTCAAAIRARGK